MEFTPPERPDAAAVVRTVFAAIAKESIGMAEASRALTAQENWNDNRS
jgi:hypothetical protein